MKNSRFKHDYRLSASKLHKAIGEALRTGPFKLMKVYQEYPVSRVLPGYPHTNQHFDWVVMDMKVVIEGHGAQHYKPVCWSKDMTPEEAQDNLAAVKFRDNQKLQAAVDAGFTYIAIPYTEIKLINSLYLVDKIQEHWTWEFPACPDPPKELDRKQKQREYRRQQYQVAKQRKKVWDEQAKSSRHQEDDSATQDEEV